MLKLLYAGLVATFSGVLILVSAQQGLFSREGKSGLTANFQLVSEIPISSSPGENFKNMASDGTFKKVVAVPVASPKSIEIVIPAPKSDPVPVPVFTPLSPTKVALPTPPPTPTPAPIIAPILTPESILALQPDPIPATDPEPEPTSAPEPQSTPTPEPTPLPELEPTPPPPVPEPTTNPVISEILFDAVGADGGKEFIKIFNPNNTDFDLNDWSLKNGDNSLVKIGSKPEDVLVIKPNNYLIIGFSGNIAADITRSATLPNGAVTIVLINVAGEVVDSASYDGANFEEGESWKNS